jgi:hypothetical protein
MTPDQRLRAIEIAKSVLQGKPTDKLIEMRIPFSYVQSAHLLSQYVLLREHDEIVDDNLEETTVVHVDGPLA